MWDTVGSPERVSSGSQSGCRILFILPAHGSSNIIIWGNGAP